MKQTHVILSVTVMYITKYIFQFYSHQQLKLLHKEMTSRYGMTVYFKHIYLSISLQTSPHTSSNSHKAQNFVVNLALQIVLKSLIPPLLNFNLNLKAMRISWEKPTNLNQQVHHVNLTLAL